MKFTPNYTVSYHGTFHVKGIPFDIADKDAAEMSRHGEVEYAQQVIPSIAATPVQPEKPVQTAAVEEPVKRRGRKYAGSAKK